LLACNCTASGGAHGASMASRAMVPRTRKGRRGRADSGSVQEPLQRADGGGGELADAALQSALLLHLRRTPVLLPPLLLAFSLVSNELVTRSKPSVSSSAGRRCSSSALPGADGGARARPLLPRRTAALERARAWRQAPPPSTARSSGAPALPPSSLRPGARPRPGARLRPSGAAGGAPEL